MTASAGTVSEALVFTEKDTLFHEADLALIAAKRSGHAAAIYTPEMESRIRTAGADDNVHYTQTLANALARAVDAKDSYTRSHSQTVSQLAVLIAAELNLDAARIARIRLAGLLHDVGKIGVPDAILSKPGKLPMTNTLGCKPTPFSGTKSSPPPICRQRPSGCATTTSATTDVATPTASPARRSH